MAVVFFVLVFEGVATTVLAVRAVAGLVVVGATYHRRTGAAWLLGDAFADAGACGTPHPGSDDGAGLAAHRLAHGRAGGATDRATDDGAALSRPPGADRCTRSATDRATNDGTAASTHRLPQDGSRRRACTPTQKGA